MIEFSIVESSLGRIFLVARDRKLIELSISAQDIYTIEKEILKKYPDARQSVESFKKVHRMLDRYLKGEYVDFDVETDLSCYSDFVRRILMKVKEIPYGQVRSYDWIGKQSGYPRAQRAAGQAVKRNPIPIIIPCHRVTRKDGTIGGFSMGIEIKRKLLAIEGIKFSE